MDNDLLEYKVNQNSNKIETLERKVDDLVDFKYTVNALSTTVNDLKQTVDKIVNQDGENYRTIKKQALTTIISLVLGALFGSIVSKLF